MNSKERLDKALKIIEKEKNLTREAITKSLGYKSKNYLSDLVSSEKPVTDFVLDKLEHKYGLNKEYVITGKGEAFNIGIENSNNESKKETDSGIPQKEETDSESMKAVIKLIDSNKLLAESNKVLVDGNMKLIRMVEKATAGGETGIPAAVAAKFEEILALMAHIAAGKRYKTEGEAFAELHKLFYDDQRSERGVDIASREGTFGI